MTPAQVEQWIVGSNPAAVAEINTFTHRVFRTRGGREGSGMGLLLEGLWAFHTTAELARQGRRAEIAWLGGHEYNDYAVVDTQADHDPDTRAGEFLRVEAKSTRIGAAESKAHFDALQSEIGPHDLMLVLAWDWRPVGRQVVPQITDSFLGSARQLAKLRDALHLARGGSFVVDGQCPDGCGAGCIHAGEPLNRKGSRERASGPLATKPKNQSHLANFGGMSRMVGVSTRAARQVLASLRAADPVADAYVAFRDRALK